MTSQQIKKLQTNYNKYGFNCGKVDGIMGPKTIAAENAVKAFQKKNNLVADGIIGPQTIKALTNTITPKITPAPRRISDRQLSKDKVKFIILHHTASAMDLTWNAIDKLHIARFHGQGFGYHFKIKKDGTIQAGRPLNVIGEQCRGLNSVSIGVVFDGNMEVEQITKAQIESGLKLIKWLKDRVYNGVPKIIGHKEAHAIDQDATITACPGKNFPLKQFKEV